MTYNLPLCYIEGNVTGDESVGSAPKEAARMIFQMFKVWSYIFWDLLVF